MHSCTLSQLLYLWGKICSGKTYIQSQCFRSFQLVCCARGTKDGSANRMCQLYCCRSHAASCRVNEYALTHLQTALREEGIVCRHKNFRDRCCLYKIKVFGYLNQQPFMYHKIFRLSAAACDSHHALSWFPTAYQWSDCVNLSSKFHPWNIGW